MAADVFSDYEGFEDSNVSPPPPPARTSCSGSISLHSKTYRRGANETFDDTINEVPSEISTKLTSLEVRGDCCWKVFTEINLGGKHQLFQPGEFDSASQMGPVFRSGASIEKIIDC